MSTLFDFEKKSDPYAVMGNPISHSKSPQIHTAFAQQTHQPIIYQAIHVDQGGFSQAVGNFFANGGKGLNITVPFKEEAWKLADSRSSRAQLAGAVNTIILNKDGSLLGENTDGIGLVNDLINNNHIVLSDKSVLLLGAGGAARGVILPLLEAGVRTLTIANRTIDRAQNLIQHFAENGGSRCQAVGLDKLNHQNNKPGYDIIINATSASLHAQQLTLPDDVISNTTCCYDMMYAAKPGIFLQWSAKLDAHKSIDGLGMLVEQAAESFYLWRGVKPETNAVIKAIRAELGA